MLVYGEVTVCLQTMVINNVNAKVAMFAENFYALCFTT